MSFMRDLILMVNKIAEYKIDGETLVEVKEYFIMMKRIGLSRFRPIIKMLNYLLQRSINTVIMEK